MTIDFGLDLACTDDLDPAMGEVSGLEGVKQAAYRRLTTQRGQLLGDPFYGIDVRDFLSAEVTAAELAQIPPTIAAELQKDERILSVTALAAWNAATSKLTIAITCTTGEGPFSMTLSVDKVTVELLAGGA